MPNFTPIIKSLERHLLKQKFNSPQILLDIDNVGEYYIKIQRAIHSKTFGEYVDGLKKRNHHIM
jgi:hypothetical protein